MINFNNKGFYGLFVLALCLLPFYLWSTDYVWDGDSDADGDGVSWTDPNNWTADSGYPDDVNDKATINSQNDAINTNSTNIVVGSVSIDAGFTGTLTLEGTFQVDNSGTQDGNFYFSGSNFSGVTYDVTVLNDFEVGGGTFTSTSGTLHVSGDFTHSAGTFTHNGGTVEFSQVSDHTITNIASTTFNNLTLHEGATTTYDDADLLYYFALDDTNTTARDYSANLKNGSHVGGVADNAVVAPTDFTNSKSLFFPGSDDYVSIDNAGLPTGDFTYAVFIKLDDLNNSAIFCSDESSGGQEIYLRVNSVSRRLRLQIDSTGVGQSNTPLTTDRWYHVGVTRLGGTITFYLDGMPDGSFTDATVLNFGIGSMLIGIRLDLNQDFDGLMDDFRVYSRALTAEEMLSLGVSHNISPGESIATTTLNGNLNVDGDLSFTSGTLNTGNYDITFAGDWINTAMTFVPGTGTVTYDGTGSSVIKTHDQNFNNFFVNSSGGTISLNSDLKVTNRFHQIMGSFTATTYDVTVAGSSASMLISGGTFNSTSNELVVSGDYIHSAGTFTNNSGNVVLAKTADQTLTIPASTTFNNMYINDGLKVYLKCEESSTPSIDSSGYGHNAVWFDTTDSSTSVPTVNFTNTRSLNFNASNNYVEIIDPDLPTEDFTYCTFINADDATGVTLIQVLGSVSDEFSLELNSNNKLQLTLNGDTQVTADTALSTGTWYHIGVVRSGSDITFYLDGATDGTATDGTVLSDIATLILGTNEVTGLDYDGRLDEIRIYDRALSTAEMLTLSQGNLPGTSVATTTTTNDLDVNGNLIIASGTLSPGTDDITLAGNWLNVGGVFTDGTAAVTLDGSSLQRIASGGQNFYNLYNKGIQAYFSENVTIDNSLIVHSGIVTAGTVSMYFSNGADFRVGGGSSSPAIVSFDGTIVTTDSSTSTDKFFMSIRDGGDIHAKQQTQFNYLDGGIVFYSGSQMGSNVSASGGQSNFMHVTFDNIADGEFGLDFTQLESSDADQFIDHIEEVRFNKIAGATTAGNVSADSSTPRLIFQLNTTNFGTVATDGESGDTDASDKITWNVDTTWVSLSDFKALGHETNNGVNIKWSTTAEIDNKGFNIYRSFERHGKYVKVNRKRITTFGDDIQSLKGSDYHFFDPLPKRGKIVYYKLEDVERRGKKTLHGPITVDWDRDGIFDDWELSNGFDNLNLEDAHADSDGDTLSNLNEYLYGFDPHQRDSDEDGIPDNLEERSVWNGPVIPGINAKGEGLTVIGKDPLGVTFELNIEKIIKEIHTYKKKKYYHMSFSNMSTEYPTKKGQLRLPLKQVLLNLPSDRTIEIKTLIENWSEIEILDQLIEPVPSFQKRPLTKKKWVKELLKYGQIEKEINKSNYSRQQFLWSALMGGKKHQKKYFERERMEGQEVYDDPNSKFVEVFNPQKSIYKKNTYFPSKIFEAGNISNIGTQQALLLGIRPVKYNPVTGELRYLKKLRFRVNYIYDPKVLIGKTADWRKDYQLVNQNKPAYLNHQDVVEIKVRKPAYSDDGDLHDKTLVKLKWAELTAAGVDWQVDHLHLYQGHYELSLKEVDDGIIFYIDRGLNESINNDHMTVYAFQDFLTPVKRWESIYNQLNYDQELTSFSQTIRFENNNYSLYMLYSPDTLFVNKTSITSGYTKSYGFNLPGISSTGIANLSARMYSQYDFEPLIDIGAQLKINAETAPFASPEWAGHSFHRETQTINASQFNDGANMLNIMAIAPTGTPYNKIRLDYIEATYPRTLKAYQEKLLVNHKLKSGNTRIKVSGFSTPSSISVLDITDPTRIKEITNLLIGDDYVEVNVKDRVQTNPIKTMIGKTNDTDLGDDDSKWTQNGKDGNTQLLFVDLKNTASISSAKKIIGNTHIRGRQSALDHMIIVDESLHAKAEELVTHLSGYDQSVELVTFQDLQKEYSQGEYSTAAIKNYVNERWKTAPFNGKPQYLTLIGSGNYNNKGLYNFPNELPLIPSPILRTNFSKKASAADWEYTKVTDDDFPDLSVGRIDCGTVAELDNIISKIKLYENTNDGQTTPKALLVTDHDPTFDLYLFDNYMNRVLKSFEDPWSYSKLYRTENTAHDMTNGIVNSLNNEQINLLLFNGHGSFREWGKDLFWRHSHLGSLQSGHFLPVIIEANCISSDFYHVAYKGLGTQMLQLPEAGAIAVIGNTSMTAGSSKLEVFVSTVDNLLRRGFPEVGKALMRAKIESSVKGFDQDNSISTLHLLGLPSLKLKGSLSKN